MKALDELVDSDVVRFDDEGTGISAAHVFDAKSILAVRAALAARRPLLVRGEPGTGKSQLARAAACVLRRVFLSMTVHARTEAQDVFWELDMVERLAAAQIQGPLGGTPEEVKDRLDVSRFLRPGPLWWAFDWPSASAQAELVECDTPSYSGESSTPGSVVLIDEIDKADSSVPNGLLEALGDRAFRAPGHTGRISMSSEEPPLVVLTTNEERALPDAFLRRCLVLQLSLPDDRDELVEQLVRRGRAHHPDVATVSDTVLEKAAQQLALDRTAVANRGLVPPGQAEYLDLIRALIDLSSGDEGEQIDALEDVSRFVFEKHPRDKK